MQVKYITDEDLLEYIELYVEAVKESTNGKGRTNYNILLDIVNQNIGGLYHWGLFKQDKLVGFVNGKALTSSVFYFNDMYVKKEARIGVKLLVQTVEEEIQQIGFKLWLAKAQTEEGDKLLHKLGDYKLESVIEDLYGKEPSLFEE